jgi:hypothetical protein
MHLKLIKRNRRMSTCNRLELQTLRSQLIMPKNLPDHWSGGQRSTIPCKGGELEIEAKAPKEVASLAQLCE